MKLNELLGAELYEQVQAKLDEANANEPDKLKHIRYADLSEGEYVGKAKHDALQAKYDGTTQELATAQQLIAELKKGTKGNDELQGKITAYETQVADLQTQLAATKLKAAIKVALLTEKVADVDYLTYKLNEKLGEKGEKLELDENENIKGWDSHLAGLKTQFPTMFENGNTNNGFKPLDGNGLPSGDTSKSITKEEFDRMGYQSRLKLKQEQPEVYDAMVGRN